MRPLVHFLAGVCACGFFSTAVQAQLGSGLTTGLTLNHDDRVRTYDVYLPSAGAGQPRPLVLDLHAFGDNRAAQRSRSGFQSLADAEGFVVAWPDGVAGSWNYSLGGQQLPGTSTADEQGFLKSLVTEISEATSIDLDRVYATGWSSGGDMATALACAAGDVFAAVAPVAAGFPTGYDAVCLPQRPFPILMFRGDTDELVPYQGGQGSLGFGGVTILSATDTLQFWRQKNQCGGDFQRTSLGGVSSCSVYQNCTAGADTGLCTVRGAQQNGHELYINVDNVKIAREAWAFLSQHQRPEISSGFEINAGLTGAWYNEQTPGQGFLLEPIPAAQTLFAAWFTFDDAAAKLGAAEHRWLTLQGPYSGDTAQLDVFVTSGGQFDTPGSAETAPVGTAQLRFSDCTTAVLDYTLNDGPAGSINLVRLTPDSFCASGGAPVAVQHWAAKGQGVNAGLSGAWYDPAAAGQGMVFDVVPAIDLFFMAWFTFEAGEPGKAVGHPQHRWLTAQGSVSQPAQLTLTRTSGGVFNNPAPVTQHTAGQVSLDFESCTAAQLQYDLPDQMLSGTIQLQRLTPDVNCAALLK